MCFTTERMNQTVIPILCSMAALSGCQATDWQPSRQEAPVIVVEREPDRLEDGRALVVQTVLERALAYPDAKVSNVVVSPNGRFVCGIIRDGERRPYAFKGFFHDGSWSVVGPHLVREGSWDEPENLRRSVRAAAECGRAGAVVAFPAAASEH